MIPQETLKLPEFNCKFIYHTFTITIVIPNPTLMMNRILQILTWWPNCKGFGPKYFVLYRKIFVFAKQHPQVSKHFEIYGKTFAVQAKTTKILALECFVLYSSYITSI